MSGMRTHIGAILALLVLLTAVLWEGGAALRAPARVPRDEEWAGASREVRAGFAEGDLIVFAPAWTDPRGRKELGDLMPLSMVGRPDALTYGRIWEIGLDAARAGDTMGLPVEHEAWHGRLRVRRYRQQALEVTYDLAARFHALRVAQVAAGAEGAAERPCLYAGPLPGEAQVGPRGGFVCRSSRVVLRTLEIDYAPRLGIEVPVEAGQRTLLEVTDIPEGAWRGARLWLFFGLHDYYARKTESGPVDVVVTLGQSRPTPISVPPAGWHRVIVDAREGAPPPSLLRIEISARDARARHLGLLAQVRR